MRANEYKRLRAREGFSLAVIEYIEYLAWWKEMLSKLELNNPEHCTAITLVPEPLR